MMSDESHIRATPPEDAPSLIEEWLRERAESEESPDPALWQERLARAAELLSDMHEADIADLLERLPDNDRATVLALMPQSKLGAVLAEVSAYLCDNLVALTPADTMVAALTQMQSDDVAALLRELRKPTAARLMRLAGLADNREVRASLAFDANTVGALMDYQPVLADEAETAADIIARLRRAAALPPHCDKLFIVDDWERLTGVLPLKYLLQNPPDARIADIMVSDHLHTFTPDDSIEEAADAFEKYNLITAPVLDDDHKVIGRIAIDDLFDEMRESRNRDLLTTAGVREDEDLFAPLLRRFGNRWRWLFINLVAAFVISRVVGLFEGAIEQIVALAALMPIVAGMSGNIGNQTATLTIRALALGHISRNNWRPLLISEVFLSLINGAVWGAFAGAFAYFLYQRVDLAVVLLVSMTLCFLAGALTGFAVPLFMQRLKRDPALGATVVVSAVTDTFGFFVFLGMSAFLLL